MCYPQAEYTIEFNVNWAMDILSTWQHKKYIQAYVTSKPDGHKISSISGGVLNEQQVSGREKPETWPGAPSGFGYKN